MSNTWADWSYPTAMRFGTGRITELAHACTAVTMQRPLFVPGLGIAPLAAFQSVLAVGRDAGFAGGLFACRIV